LHIIFSAKIIMPLTTGQMVAAGVCCILIVAALLYAVMGSSSPSSSSAPPASASTTPAASGNTASSSTTTVPSGMIQGKIIQVARADNRAEYINLLGIDVFDQSGNRITSGITPTISPGVYSNDTSHFGPQFLIDGVHTETDSSGQLRLPHSTNVPNAYHQLDLGQDTIISKIVIYNRTACCSDRINGCNLIVNNAAGTNVLTIPLTGAKAVYTFGTPLTNSTTSSTYIPQPYALF